MEAYLNHGDGVLTGYTSTLELHSNIDPVFEYNQQYQSTNMHRQHNDYMLEKSVLELNS